MTNYLEALIGDSLFNDDAWTGPDHHVALLTAAAGEASGGTEVANAGAYTRQQVYRDSTTTPYWSLYTAGVYDNVQDITWSQATAAWGDVSHFKISNSGTWGGGQDLIHGALTSTKTVDNNDTFKFTAGDLDMTLD
jgi:hypothetical protein